MQTADKIKEKKDVISQEFNKIYLEGKGHGFSKVPKDEEHFRKVILSIEKYDEALSRKLAVCRSRWMQAGIMGGGGLTNVSVSKDEIRYFDECRRIAEILADEAYEEIKRKWIT